MGLAASQARFLGITARKSNIEYEGQQVNQQRTALAEEVNALYSKLLALDVPVAPDTTEFYETSYSFEVTNTSGEDGEYIIKSYYQNADGTYTVNTERSYQKEVAVGSVQSNATYPITSSTDDAGNTVYSIGGVKESPIQLTKLDPEDTFTKDMIAKINAAYPNKAIADGNTLYSYKDDQGITHYIDEATVTSSPVPNNYSTYTKAQKEFIEQITFENATVGFDENNRMNSINLDGTTTLEVGTTRTYNSEGYDAALRDYTMSKDEYDKMVADLNAQTETLQQEDKVLELRLNQIDTEQNELQTELEAVKSVLDKNIENTFKTFA